MWLAIEYELNLVPGTIFFNISAPPTPDLSGNRWSKDFFKLPVLAFCCFQFIVLTWEKTAVEQRVSVGVYCCAAAIHDGHADGHWSMVMPMVMVMSCQWSCYLWWSCWQLMVMPVPSAKIQFWYEVASLGWESHNLPPFSTEKGWSKRLRWVRGKRWWLQCWWWVWGKYGRSTIGGASPAYFPGKPPQMSTENGGG